MRESKQLSATSQKCTADVEDKQKGVDLRASAALQLDISRDFEEEISILVESNDDDDDDNATPAASTSLNAKQSSETTSICSSAADNAQNAVETHCPATKRQVHQIQSTSTRILGNKRQQTSLKNAGLQYLKESRLLEAKLKRKDQELEERRLQLEESKLAFEKQKFEYDKQDREARFKLEMAERQHNLEVLKQQQNIINYFINK